MAYTILITFTSFYLLANIVRGESPTMTITTPVQNMSNPLDQIPMIAIEPVGVFQYLLINVSFEGDLHRNATSKLIVRGKKYAKSHAEIYEEESEKLHKLGLKCECVGGGRIKHAAGSDKIFVFGYSKKFGMPNHEYTRYLLRQVYTNNTIYYSNNGYYRYQFN